LGSRLSGSVALITGAARGQGASHARLFAEEGCRVMLADILDDLGLREAASLRDEGLEADYRHLDVTRAADWTKAVTTTEERFGKLTILVNNAGIFSEAGAVEESEARWHEVIGVNQTGVFLGMKHAIPAIRRAGGGAVVNISSTLGLAGVEDWIAYQASKGAVVMMSRSAALSYARDGVRVNTVCPGIVRTPMWEAEDPAVRERDLDFTPMGRPASPEEVSRGVLYLASSEASFVTGTELAIDGGYLAQ
jgi:NAD(P)-dependent dehydrogenase (short-subunit alcohol dehydrogenase family)